MKAGGSKRGFLFQLTLPVWGATNAEHLNQLVSVISTHAPRVGSDRKGPPALTGQLRISTHAPRVGSDPQEIMLIINEYEFQLTLPVWGATTGAEHDDRHVSISTHAPRVGSDKV